MTDVDSVIRRHREFSKISTEGNEEHMEWVETTAKTVEEAKDAALDRLGVAADEAEFEIVEEPKPGLFGRTRGEGRVRARVRPTPVRPKQERRRRSKAGTGDKATDSSDSPGSDAEDQPDEQPDTRSDRKPNASSTGNKRASTRRRDRTPQKDQDTTMSNHELGERNERNEHDDVPVPPADVGAAAVAFMDGLVGAFGTTGSSDLEIDGIELDVRVTGDELGLLVGPGGRTLNAIQDLARVSAQRRLGDHETRLRIDLAGYRERRSEALRRFASDVAASVRESGSPRALEPMTSADRKVVHDALGDEDGVSSRSEGDDPNRRIVVVPD